MDPHSRLLTTKIILPKRAHNQARPTIQKGQICQSHHHPYAKSSLPTDDLSKGCWDKLQREWHSSDELSWRVLGGRHDDETDTDRPMYKQLVTPALTRGVMLQFIHFLI